MSKPVISAFVVGFLAAVGVPGVVSSATAADLAVPYQRSAAAHYCGCCGCLHASHVYHRELRSTYGLAYDPRNYDQTEPHYYFGPVRAYPRYWVSFD